MIHRSIEAPPKRQMLAFVAQICNLLCRRILFGGSSQVRKIGVFRRSADWKSAIQQVGNPRYQATLAQRPFSISILSLL
jgi:hypothetical protein